MFDGSVRDGSQSIFEEDDDDKDWRTLEDIKDFEQRLVRETRTCEDSRANSGRIKYRKSSQSYVRPRSPRVLIFGLNLSGNRRDLCVVVKDLPFGFADNRNGGEPHCAARRSFLLLYPPGTIGAVHRFGFQKGFMCASTKTNHVS